MMSIAHFLMWCMIYSLIDGLSKYFHFLFSLVSLSSKTHVPSSIFVFFFFFKSLTRYYSID